MSGRNSGSYPNPSFPRRSRPIRPRHTPVTLATMLPSGRASASTARYSAPRRASGTAASARRSLSLFRSSRAARPATGPSSAAATPGSSHTGLAGPSGCSSDQRADRTPGSPPRASTQSPESSASACMRANRAHSAAFFSAFAANVAPSSSTSGSARPRSSGETTRIGSPATSRRSSRSFPGFVVPNRRSIASPRLRAQRRRLQVLQPQDALDGDAQHPVEGLAPERPPLRRALDLDELAVAGGDHVHVHVGGRVLVVVEVEPHLAVEDADGHRRHVALDGLARELLLRPQPADREREGDPSAGDGRRARAAVRLDDVAVDRDGPRPERAQVPRGAERAPDEPLDLEGPPALVAAGRLARHALVRGARQHPVLGRDPPRAGAEHVRRHLLLDRRGAEHVGVAEAGEARALRVLRHAGLEEDRAELAVAAAVLSHAGADSTREPAAPRLRGPLPARVPRLGAERADAFHDRVGGLLLVLARAQLPPLLLVRDEADLEEDRGHARPGEDVERRLLHAAVLGAELLEEPLVDVVREPRRGPERVRVLQVGEDPRDRIVRIGPWLAREAVRVLARGDGARVRVGRVGRQEVGLDALRVPPLLGGGHG